MRLLRSVLSVLVAATVHGDRQHLTAAARAIGRHSSKPRLSQGGQHHVLRWLFKTIGTTNRYYVEFGFNPNEHCRGSGPNSCSLWLEGWDGLLLDGNSHNESINLHTHFLSSANIVSLFRRYRVPESPDYVSVDIDSTDLWILRSILASVYRPRVISVEFNSNYPWGYPISFPDPTTMPVSADGRFYSGTCYYGVSAMALVLMAEAWGYVTVSLVEQFDLFMVSKELADKYQLPSIRPRLEANAHFRSAHRPMTHAQASNLVDYGTWQALVDGGGETGTAIVDAARRSARLMIANLTRMSSSDERLRCFSGMA